LPPVEDEVDRDGVSTTIVADSDDEHEDEHEELVLPTPTPVPVPVPVPVPTPTPVKVEDPVLETIEEVKPKKKIIRKKTDA
jgi:hypothetical protein